MDRTAQEDCFDRWIRDHAAILHRVARGFAEGHAEQADLMQELLLAVWRAVPAFRAEASPATFIYRVSHNAAMTWRRGERTYRRHVQQFEAEAVAASAPASPDRDRLERLYAAIRRLPELDRSLILLALDGVSYREMAAVHGLTESNIGARLTRVRARLAEELRGESP